MQQYKITLIRKKRVDNIRLNMNIDLSYYMVIIIHEKRNYIQNVIKDRKMKKKKWIFIAITFIWVGVIYSFSLQPGDISGDMSGSLVRRILALFMPGVLDNPEQLEMWHFIFRKCGHFAEYLVLGVLSTMTVLQMELRNRNVFGIGFCVLVASVDETIQLFVSGRAGRMQDVMIDTSGAIVGTFIMLICINTILKKKKT